MLEKYLREFQVFNHQNGENFSQIKVFTQFHISISLANSPSPSFSARQAFKGKSLCSKYLAVVVLFLVHTKPSVCDVSFLIQEENSWKFNIFVDINEIYDLITIQKHLILMKISLNNTQQQMLPSSATTHVVIARVTCFYEMEKN